MAKLSLLPTAKQGVLLPPTNSVCDRGPDMGRPGGADDIDGPK